MIEHEKNFDCFEAQREPHLLLLGAGQSCPDLTHDGECLVKPLGGNEELSYGPTR
jgi:hypothetical protein